MMMEGAIASAADFEACKTSLRHGSKSFHLASKLLPVRVRMPASALYAFCRLADDAVDLEGGDTLKGGDRLKGDGMLEGGGMAAIARLEACLDRVYAKAPADDPMERALADVVARFAIPRSPLDALLEGLSWDANGRRFDEISCLFAYAARVASTVGVITTLMMGVRDQEALARAADLGVAMQLTNIARDVGEDARAGRLYLPRRWMHEAGLDPETWLAAPCFDERLALVVSRLLRTADDLYRRSIAGIARLPLDCRVGIHAARLIYADIGREVERQGWNSIDRRAIVPKSRKLILLAKALGSSLRHGVAETLEPLEETRFLMVAIKTTPLAEPGIGTPCHAPWWNLDARIGWTIDLFARLEREEQLQRAASRR